MPNFDVTLDDGRKVRVDADSSALAARGAAAWAKSNPMRNVTPPKPPAGPTPWDDFTAPIKAAGHEVMEDVRRGRGRSYFPGSPVDSSIPDLAGAAVSPLAGALNVGVAPAARAVAGSGLPLYKYDQGAFAPPRKLTDPKQRAGSVSDAIGTALWGLGGEGAAAKVGEVGIRGERAASAPRTGEEGSSGTRLPPGSENAPRPRKPHASSRTGPILEEPAPGERIHQTQERLDDGLNRLRKSATADQVEARQFLTSTPKHLADPRRQAQLYDEIEGRMIDSERQAPPDLAEAEAHLQPWKDEEHALASELKARGASADDVTDLPSGRQGYVHRIRQGKGSYLDPADTGGAQGADPIAGRGLSKHAGSLKPRQYFVAVGEDGKRTFLPRELTDARRDLKVGDKLPASDGTERTVQHATTAEIEANEPGAAYHKNALVNTVENVLRLRRVKRNLDFLDAMTAQLKDQGLAHREEWHFKNDDGQWVRARANEATPEGFVETDIPQLKGWKFDKRIADTLNDFYRTRPEGDLAGVLSKVNRFLVGSMFFNPVVHIENVGTHWAVGRGWDWFTPAGWHSLFADGARAMRAVATQNDDYTRMLREGSGLLYGDVANDNFYKLMIEKMGHDLQADPHTWGGIARDLGFGGSGRFDPVRATASMVKQIYRASSKALWAVNDMFLLQRQFELERKGLATRKAIFQAERDIPNYRVPTQVMGQRWLREALTNPNITAFGRYNYGRFRALATMIKDVVKGGEPGARTDAIGKMLVMGLMAFGIAPFANKVIQGLTGNKDAKLRGAGPFGPMDAAIELAHGDRDWMTFMSSILTPAPVIGAGTEATRNRDVFGRKVVDEQASPLGKAVQAGEAVGGQVYPVEQVETAAKPGGPAQAAGSLVGVKLPPPGSKEKQAVYRGKDRAAARRREARDPIEQAIRKALAG